MRAVFIEAGLAAACALEGQDAEFSSKVTNVHVDAVAMIDRQILRGLGKEDFVIRDGDQIRPILSFQEQTLPLDLVLLVDAVAVHVPKKSPEKIVSEITSAAAKAIQQMRPMDRTAVISFGIDPRLEQGLTSDSNAITAALSRIRPVSPSSRSQLAIQWAAWLLEADEKIRGADEPERKRAILMVAGGENPAVTAWVPDEPTIQQLWNRNLALNAIMIPRDFGLGDWLLKTRLSNPLHIARATGGDVVFDPGNASLQQTMVDLLARIQSSYTMFYSPPAERPGELRRVTVELSDEAKKKYPGAVVHAREGYIAK